MRMAKTLVPFVLVLAAGCATAQPTAVPTATLQQTEIPSPTAEPISTAVAM